MMLTAGKILLNRSTIVKGQSGKGDQQDRVNVLESVMATEQYCNHVSAGNTPREGV